MSKTLEQRAREFVAGVAEHECGAYIGSPCPVCDYRIPRLTALLREAVREERKALREVAQLTNRLNADSQNFEIECLISEVERLKHLIFVWRQASYSGTPDEYQRAAVSLEEEALRVSVVRAAGEHRKHPSGDHCVFCRSQWPCEEAEP